MNFKGVIQILLESRYTDVINKYADNIKDIFGILYDDAVNVIKGLSENDPSGNNKYLDWMANQVASKRIDNLLELTQKIIGAVKKFHNNIEKITPKVIQEVAKAISIDLPESIQQNPKDINSYPTYELLNLVASYAEHNLSKKELRDVVRGETEKLYEDNELLIVKPKSYRSSCYYGATTKWCITSKTNKKYWEDYSSEGEFIFIIPKQRPNDKIAVYLKDNGNVYFFNAIDQNITEYVITNWENNYPILPKAKKILYDIFFSDLSKYKKVLTHILTPEVLFKIIIQRGLDPIDALGKYSESIIKRGFKYLYPEDGYKRMADYFASKGYQPWKVLDTDEFIMALHQMGKDDKDIFNTYLAISKINEEYHPLKKLSKEFLLQIFGDDMSLINYIVKNKKLVDLDDYYSITELFDIFDNDYEDLSEFLEEHDLEYILEDIGELKTYKIYLELYQKTEDPEKKKSYWNKVYDVLPKNDVTFNDDGTITLEVSGWDEFIGLFPSGGRDIDYQYVAKQVLSEDGIDWEPFYDVVQDWYDEVWYATNADNIKYIRELITEKINNGEDIEIWVEDWGDVDDYEEWISEDGEDGMFHLTVERLNEISDSDLGKIIEEDDYFDDWLKNEMLWAYEWAYNEATKNNYYRAYCGAIEEVLQADEPKWHYTGRYETYKSGGNEYKSEILELHFPNLRSYWSVIDAYVECNDDYVEDFQYDYYLGILEDVMRECNYEGGLLEPNVHEWPDSYEVERLYNENLRDRI